MIFSGELLLVHVEFASSYFEIAYFSQCLQLFRFAKNFADLTTGMIFVTFILSISWICTSFFQIHSVKSRCRLPVRYINFGSSWLFLSKNNVFFLNFT